jgi:hypothetical protein
MKSKINTLVLLAVGLVAFSASSSSKGISSTHQQFQGPVFKDGPWPMCFPHNGCGFRDSMVLVTDGTMCPPNSGCGSANIVPRVDTEFHARVLLADGPGPMCPPTSGCGNGNIVLRVDTESRAQVLLADGPGPMCPPHSGCGYAHDARIKNSAA